jgi:uncharacterized protein YvpB
VSVSKEQIADEIPYSDDPNVGFGGDPYTDSGGVIYPAALMGVVKAYLGSAVDLTGAPWETLTSYIDAGKPVIVWFVPRPGFSHTVVLTGYTDRRVAWAHDPIEGPDIGYQMDSFREWWGLNGYRALSY